MILVNSSDLLLSVEIGWNKNQTANTNKLLKVAFVCTKPKTLNAYILALIVGVV